MVYKFIESKVGTFLELHASDKRRSRVALQLYRKAADDDSKALRKPKRLNRRGRVACIQAGSEIDDLVI